MVSTEGPPLWDRDALLCVTREQDGEQKQDFWKPFSVCALGGRPPTCQKNLKKRLRPRFSVRPDFSYLNTDTTGFTLIHVGHVLKALRHRCETTVLRQHRACWCLKNVHHNIKTLGPNFFV